MTLCSFLAFAVRFSPQAETDAQQEHALALANKRRLAESAEQASESELELAWV